MKAIGILLFLSLIPLSGGCLVVRLKPCDCPLLKLDRNNLDLISDHSFYRNLTDYTLKQPSVTGDNCAVSVYCEGNYDLVVLDKDSTTNFGAYSADAICTASSQTWLVSDDDGGFKPFQRLYAVCVDFKNTCTPDKPRSFLLAYSNDFEKSRFNSFYFTFNHYFGDEDLTDFATYSKVRFDVEKEEEFQYFPTFMGLLDSIVDSSYNQLPFTVPSLRFTNTSRGSDVLRVIERFLENTRTPLCGSRIVIYLKRWPNEQDITSLVERLRLQHIFVYVFATEKPSGGLYEHTMYDLASLTNGFCRFSQDDYIQKSIEYLLSITAYNGFNVTYATNQRLIGSGIKLLPPLTFDSEPEYSTIAVTFTDHLPININFHIILRLDHSNASLSRVFDSQDRISERFGSWFSFPFQWLPAGTFNVTMEYELPVDQYQTLQVRIMSYYPIKDWAPYDV
ncbi:unnamed protein product [Caenorhabditis brenneri]